MYILVNLLCVVCTCRLIRCFCQSSDCLLSELFCMLRGLIRLTVMYIEYCTGCLGILRDSMVRNYGHHLASMHVL